ncbi:hypothetical protein QJS35_19400 [Cohnella silvisoli]|uniref:Uncharacterized protein n=1 Tax=Cohnella silvisoli TaxID=2873699 RepID=A0ABV1KWW9_9BACL|nr:hypothetical protein [Cohnella silvisoli]
MKTSASQQMLLHDNDSFPMLRRTNGRNITSRTSANNRDIIDIGLIYTRHDPHLLHY